MSEILEIFRGEPGHILRRSGEFVFREGDEAREMFVVLEGEVEILVGNVLVEVAGAGSVIGEMALIERMPRAATARVRTECTLLAVDSARFESLVRQVPPFATLVMRAMAERLRRMNRLAVDGV